MPELVAVEKQFHSLFGISRKQFSSFVDTGLVFTTKKLQIDIVKLDDVLSENDPETTM